MLMKKKKKRSVTQWIKEWSDIVGRWQHFPFWWQFSSNCHYWVQFLDNLFFFTGEEIKKSKNI